MGVNRIRETFGDGTARGTPDHETAGIQAFFFGPSERRLYGCYDPPRRRARSRGVLLCNPMGPEYFSWHRGFRQLAMRLAQQGFPAMRFDYFGSGDSAGDSSQVSVAQMEPDLLAALSELRRRSRCTSVAIVGLRLGASTILSANLRGEPLAQVVLWDPILQGAALLAEILEEAQGPSGSRDRAVLEHQGFLLTPSFRDELQAIDVSRPTVPAAPRMLIVDTLPGGRAEKLAESYRGIGADVEYVFSETVRPDADAVDRITVPAKVIQSIVSWISQESS